MLQALSEKGRLITPALLPEDRLHAIRSQPFYCPQCNERVLLRAGAYVTPHFSHYKEATCTQGGGESDYHLQGKLQLYDWLKHQGIPVQLEPHLQEINQWPDILLQINQRKIVIEFQCAKIDQKEIIKRNKGYEKLNIFPIWILGANRFKQVGKNKLKLDTFTLQMLQQYSPTLPVQLLYFCPNHHSFLLVSDFHLTNSHKAIAHFSFCKANTMNFPDLFRPKYFSVKMLYENWLNEKRLFRMSHLRVYGKEAAFRNWLYEQRLHIEHLPAIIHLPNSAQHVMNVPIWQWQARFVIEFLHPLRIGESFYPKDVQAFLAPYYLPLTSKGFSTSDPGLTYIQQLERLDILKIKASGIIIKNRSIRFYSHIEEAMRGDKAVLEWLIKGS